ncbi:hypothetical protein DUNSADRAFT_6751, partial [Dunaliella salina]
AFQAFQKGMGELLEYLQTGKLPDAMVPQQNDEGFSSDSDAFDADACEGSGPTEDAALLLPAKVKSSRQRRKSKGGRRDKDGPLQFPWRVSSSLTVLDLGQIEWLRPAFHTERHIFPLNFRAVCTMSSPASGGQAAPHVLEITKAANGISPLFRISVQLSLPGVREPTAVAEGSTPGHAYTALIGESDNKNQRHKLPLQQPHVLHPAQQTRQQQLLLQEQQEQEQAQAQKHHQKMGLEMFGLTRPRLRAAIQQLPHAERCERFCSWAGDEHGGQRRTTPALTYEEKLERLLLLSPHQKLPEAITPQPCGPHVLWECDVCGEDAEYDDSVLVQCDMCGVTVHTQCYGLGRDCGAAVGGDLWLCDVCTLRDKGLKDPPACVLCPVVGGAMKRTSDWRWAHMVCASWVPEVGFGGADRVETIEGVQYVSRACLSIFCLAWMSGATLASADTVQILGRPSRMIST